MAVVFKGDVYWTLL